MQIVNFDDVREMIIESMRKKMLIPILGSGFTRACSAFQGNVPSGMDYRHHMIDAIQSSGEFASEEIIPLHSAPFLKISSIYHAVIPVEKQHEYLKANFTKILQTSHSTSASANCCPSHGPVFILLTLMMRLSVIAISGL